MTRTNALAPTALRAGRLLLCLGVLFCASAAQADLPANVQAKVNKYKQKLVEWGSNPAIIAAVKDANAKGPTGMTNAKWEELSDKDPAVATILDNPASGQLKSWDDKELSKLYVRDKDGHLVAGSNKPLLYNVSSREQFKQSIQGKVWNEAEIKTDITTQNKTVQISAPVKDGGKVIGTIHSSVIAE